MVLFDSRTGIEMIDRKGCLALLGAEDVGRIAILEGGAPLIVPVNYAMDGEAIVFRTGEGSKLSASRGGPACFEIDGVDHEHHRGWSVVARGTIEEITRRDGPTFARVQALAQPWINERSHVVRLAAWSLTGRRVGPA